MRTAGAMSHPVVLGSSYFQIMSFLVFWEIVKNVCYVYLLKFYLFATFWSEAHSPLGFIIHQNSHGEYFFLRHTNQHSKKFSLGFDKRELTYIWILSRLVFRLPWETGIGRDRLNY